MIGCVSPVTDGDLRVFGLNPRTHASVIKARLGVVPQQDNLDNEITVRENLLMYARYFDIPREVAARRADELLDFVQLSERATSDVEPLSGGMLLAVLTGLAFSAPIIAYAATLKTGEHFNVLFRLIITPLFMA